MSEPFLGKLGKFQRRSALPLQNMISQYYYHPQRSCGKVIFYHRRLSVILFTGGACMVGGVCGMGGIHGRGHVWRRACMAGGHAWQGTCPPRYYEIRSMSGWYASYWNAFLVFR